MTFAPLDQLVSALLQAADDHRADILRPIKQLMAEWRDAAAENVGEEWMVDGRTVLAQLEAAMAESDDYALRVED